MTSRENEVAPDGVRLDIDGRWLELPIHEDVDVDFWARDLVDEALRAREVEAVKGKRRAYADMFTELLAVERAAADEPDFKLISVYCYVPDEELLYTAVARLAALVLPEGSSLDDAVAAAIAPADLRYGNESVSELATASGPCIRVQQLVLDPETGGDSGVTSSLVYLWPIRQDGVFLVLACTFASPVEGGLHEPAMDELASTLTKGAQV